MASQFKRAAPGKERIRIDVQLRTNFTDFAIFFQKKIALMMDSLSRNVRQ
jgi:hypothetical protein